MANGQTFQPIEWSVATEFEGEINHLGYAGMAAGYTGTGFLAAGGANFPSGLPWQGGPKTFSDRIFWWDGTDKAPQVLEVKLPQASGYFGYAVYGDRLIIAGGEGSGGPVSEVFSIGEKEIVTLPSLPLKVTAPALLQRGAHLYLAGGDQPAATSNQFWTLDLNSTTKGWQRLADLPLTTANAAIFSIENKIYLAGGRSKNPSGVSTLNTGIFVYDVLKNSWSQEGEIEVDGQQSPFTAPAYFTYADRYLIWAGGDDGRIFHQIETYIKEIGAAQNETEKQELTRKKDYLVQHHLGFNNKVLIYDTQDKKWLKSQLLPYPAQVTTASATDGSALYIFSGEVRPGIRSPRILKGEISK